VVVCMCVIYNIYMVWNNEKYKTNIT